MLAAECRNLKRGDEFWLLWLSTKLEQCNQPADGAAGDEDEDDRDDGDDDEDDGRPDVAQLQRVQLGVAVSLKLEKGLVTSVVSR